MLGASDMRKEELVHAVATAVQERADRKGSGGVRTGPGTSKSVKYSQEVTSTDDDPERPGRSLVTTATT